MLSSFFSISEVIPHTPGDLLFFSRFIADDISANVGSGMLDASESVVAVANIIINRDSRVDRWSVELFMEMFFLSLQSAFQIRQQESLIVDDRRWFGAV